MTMVHSNQQEIRGIKLFGKIIRVPEKQETDDQPPAQKSYTGDNTQTTKKKPEKIIPCPRCNSMETKFRYFNNYNVNQPRHFCKGCQRYWTEGGTLRNVPAGAGRRKMKLPDHSGVEGFDHVSSGVQEFNFDGAVEEEWHKAEGEVMDGKLGHVSPAKRQRI